MANLHDLPTELLYNVLARSSAAKAKRTYYNWCLVSKPLYAIAVTKLYEKLSISSMRQLRSLVRSLILHRELSGHVKSVCIASETTWGLSQDIPTENWSRDSADDVGLFQNTVEKVFPSGIAFSSLKHTRSSSALLVAWKRNFTSNSQASRDALIGLLLLLVWNMQHLHLELGISAADSVPFQLAKIVQQLAAPDVQSLKHLQSLSFSSPTQEPMFNIAEYHIILAPFILLPSMRSFKTGSCAGWASASFSPRFAIANQITRLDLGEGFLPDYAKIIRMCPKLVDLTIRVGLGFYICDHLDFGSVEHRLKLLSIIRSGGYRSYWYTLLHENPFLSLSKFTNLEYLSLDTSVCYHVVIRLRQSQSPFPLPKTVKRLELHEFPTLRHTRSSSYLKQSSVGRKLAVLLEKILEACSIHKSRHRLEEVVSRFFWQRIPEVKIAPRAIEQWENMFANLGIRFRAEHAIASA